jgi:hypothetical protein
MQLLFIFSSFSLHVSVTIDHPQVFSSESFHTFEKYYIYKISREKLHMNDKHIGEHNPIFGELQKNLRRAHFPHHSTLPLNTVTKRYHTAQTHNS